MTLRAAVRDAWEKQSPDVGILSGLRLLGARIPHVVRQLVCFLAMPGMWREHSLQIKRVQLSGQKADEVGQVKLQRGVATATA